MKIAIDSTVRLKPQRSSLFFKFKSSFCPLFVLNNFILPTRSNFPFGFSFSTSFPKWILALPVAITALAAACHSWLGTCQVSHKFKTYSPPPTPLHTCTKMILQREFKMRPLSHTAGWQVSFPRCYSPKGGLIMTLLCTMKYNYFIANRFQKCLS